MALIECPECGRNVSTKAKSCPHCGARMPYRPSLAFILIAGLIVVFAVKANYDSGHDTAPAPTAAERAAKEAEQRRYLAVAIVAKKVKNAMRDPESVVWESIRADEKAETVCLSYRARNGFGGMTREAVTVTPTGSGRDAALWNRHCAGKELYDMLYVRNAI